MQDPPQHFERGAFTITTDRTRIDLDAALELLRRTRWGGDMTQDLLAQAAIHSICFGVYEGASLVGFARVVTDLTTYGYLTDVVIDEARRGQGLGRWLVECILAHNRQPGECPDLRLHLCRQCCSCWDSQPGSVGP